MNEKLHIGILRTDSVLPRFQEEFGDYPAMFRQVLSRVAGESVTFHVYDVEHGEYPEHLDECDGYIITGSKKSVYDDEPWIHGLKDFVVRLHENQAKTVGICFGHQMIAHALGGKAEAASSGWCVGVHESRLVSRAGFLSPAIEKFNLLSSHKDQVTLLPPGAELLATADSCPNASFRMGDHMLTFQGHPEFCKGYSKALMDFRVDILGEKYAVGIASLERDTDEATVARWILNFIGAKQNFSK